MLPHTLGPLHMLFFGWHALLSSKTLPKKVLRCFPLSSPGQAKDTSPPLSSLISRHAFLLQQ